MSKNHALHDISCQIHVTGLLIGKLVLLEDTHHLLAAHSDTELPDFEYDLRHLLASYLMRNTSLASLDLNFQNGASGSPHICKTQGERLTMFHYCTEYCPDNMISIKKDTQTQHVSASYIVNVQCIPNHIVSLAHPNAGNESKTFRHRRHRPQNPPT